MLLALDGQHVGGLFDAMLETRVQAGVLEDYVCDVECGVVVDVEPIVTGKFHVTVAGRRDGQTSQPSDAVALGTQQLLAAAAAHTLNPHHHHHHHHASLRLSDATIHMAVNKQVRPRLHLRVPNVVVQ